MSEKYFLSLSIVQLSTSEKLWGSRQRFTPSYEAAPSNESTCAEKKIKAWAFAVRHEVQFPRTSLACCAAVCLICYLSFDDLLSVKQKQWRQAGIKRKSKKRGSFSPISLLPLLCLNSFELQNPSSRSPLDHDLRKGRDMRVSNKHQKARPSDQERANRLCHFPLLERERERLCRGKKRRKSECKTYGEVEN